MVYQKICSVYLHLKTLWIQLPLAVLSIRSIHCLFLLVFIQSFILKKFRNIARELIPVLQYCDMKLIELVSCLIPRPEQKMSKTAARLIDRTLFLSIAMWSIMNTHMNNAVTFDSGGTQKLFMVLHPIKLYPKRLSYNSIAQIQLSS